MNKNVQLKGENIMKKIKNFLLFVVAVALVLSNAGISLVSAQDSGETKRIGYVINNLNDTFQTYILNAAEESAAELGYEFEVVNSEEDLIKQQDHVNTLIQTGVDGLVVVPVDTSAMGPITDAAVAAGIPLVYINRNPYVGNEDQMPEGVYYVGSEEIQAGIMQGEHAAELLDGEGGVAVLMGILGNEGAVARTAGVEQAIEEYEGMTILGSETGEWQRDQALTITENWLSAYGDELKAILANNDEMALGAIQALQNTGREDVIVMGVDAIPDAIAAIEAGTLTATMFQDAVGQGAGSVDILNALFNGETVEEKITFVEFQLVNAENVADFK